jgi:hypothetical protein
MTKNVWLTWVGTGLEVTKTEPISIGLRASLSAGMGPLRNEVRIGSDNTE